MLAKKYVKVLQQCMSTGKSKVGVVSTILKGMLGQPKNGRTPGAHGRVLADPPNPDKPASGKG